LNPGKIKVKLVFAAVTSSEPVQLCGTIHYILFSNIFLAMFIYQDKLTCKIFSLLVKK
jgi:hypothetical protein